MDNCRIDIELDRSDKVYRAGEVVSGAVLVRVRQETQCRALTASCFWQTSGKGDMDKGDTLSEELFSGLLEPGRTYRFPFSFQLPNGPCSYDGELVEVQWVVEARAKTGLLSSSMATSSFRVVPGDDARLYQHGLVEAARAHLDSGHDGAFRASGGLLSLLRALRARWSFGRSVSVTADIEPRAVSHVGSIDVRVRVSAERRTHVLRAGAVLLCHEEVNYTGMWGRTTDREEVSRQVLRFEEALNRRCEPGQELVFESQICLPDLAPSSFHACFNEVSWSVGCFVVAEGYGVWTNRVPVLVRPG